VQTRSLLFIVVFLLVALSTASAQQPQTPEERAALMRDAFASNYGKALTAELAKSLRKAADPACLNDKGLQPNQLETRGRDLLVKWGTHYAEIANSFFEPQVYAERFSASDELERLKQDADVKQYLAIAEPIRQATLLNGIFEQFERYVRLKHIKLTSVSPAATGNDELLNQDPTDATEEALEKFAAEKKSATLNRFLDLSDQSSDALSASIRMRPLVSAGPGTFFGGIEADLAELCVR
jgi:hypothetical protein